MKHALALMGLVLGTALAPAGVAAQQGQVVVTEAMNANCAAAYNRLVQIVQTASAAKPQALSDVERQCAFNPKAIERAVLLAKGQDSGANSCTIYNGNSVTIIPGESCEARNARLGLRAASGAGQPSASTGPLSIEDRINIALANGQFLDPPAESAWDLLRSRDAAILSAATQQALFGQFDAQAKRCFNDAMNASPEQIKRARTCLDAIAQANPNWQHMERDRRRLAVAIDAIGVTTDGVDAVLAGSVRPRQEQTAVAVAPIPAPDSRDYGRVGNGIVSVFQTIGLPPTPPKPADQPVTRQSQASTSASSLSSQTSPAPAQPAYSPGATMAANPYRAVAPAVSGQEPDPAKFVDTPVDTSGATTTRNPFGPVPSPATTHSFPPEIMPRQTSVTAMPVTPMPEPAQPAGGTRPQYPSGPGLGGSVAVGVPDLRPRPSVAPVANGKHVALVIGNNRYSSTNYPALPNTVNDARLVSRALEQIGFTVSTKLDRTRSEMLTDIESFKDIAARAEIAMVYYAGHAVQIADENVLMPIDAEMGLGALMMDRGITANRVRETALSTANVRILVLDSCRDDPSKRVQQYAATTRSGNSGGGLGAGLGAMTASALRNTIGEVIVFSTGPGQVALDGEGQNSPFATAFAEQVLRKTDLETVLTNINKQVQELTNSEQLPYTTDNLNALVYLAGQPQ